MTCVSPWRMWKKRLPKRSKASRLLFHHTKRFANGKTLPQAEFISAEEAQLLQGSPHSPCCVGRILNFL